MEFVSGGTLAAFLKGRPQPPKDAAELAAKVADAVHFAHHHGIVHRDLKPANILLSDNETPTTNDELNGVPEDRQSAFSPKVADFGLARHAAHEALTQSSDMLGTPSYMAPEMMSGGDHGEKDLPAVDIYGVGAILYELLTGRPPFRGESVPDTFEQVRHLDPVPVRRLQPKVPRDLETICLKCLHKEPRKRYATAADLADDLRRYLAGRPIVGRPIGPMERLAKWARRKPAWSAALGVLFVAAIALLVVGVRYERRLRESVAIAEANEREAQKQRIAAETQREKAQKSYREARATMEKMLGRLNDPRRGDLPRVRELHNDQMEDALAFYLNVAEQDPDASPEVRFEIAESRLQASLLQIHLGRPQEAKDNVQRAADLLQTLLAEQPNEPRFRRALIDCLTQQGVCSPAKERKACYERALVEAESLLASDASRWQYRDDLARLCHLLGQEAQGSKQWDEAERYYSRAIATRESLLKQYPNWRELRLLYEQTRANHLLLLVQCGRSLEDLEPLAREITKGLEAITREDPTSPQAMITLATVRINWTNMKLNFLRATVLIKELGQSIDELTAFVEREPNWMEARHTLYNAHGARAILYDQWHRYPEAANDYRRLVELASTPADRKAKRVDLALLLLLGNNSRSAMEESDRVAADPAPMPSHYVLLRHLQNCRKLADIALWSYHPYRTQAIAAARTSLERTRKDLPPDKWEAWLKSIRSAGGTAEFLKLPELAAAATGKPD
jgi:tetratricopeptide (TPR) repeat protein